MADAKTKVLPVEPTEDMVVEGLMALVKEICATQPTKGLGGVGGMSVEDAKTVMRFMDVASRMRNGKEVIACYRAMVAAAPQPADVPHDVVRALEWEHHPLAYGEVRADSGIGKYRISYCDGKVRWWGPDCVPMNASGTDEAKIAAQADYERRVRSCLATPAPSTSTATECFECDGPLHGPYCPACRPTEEALRAENARLREALKPFANRVPKSAINNSALDDNYLVARAGIELEHFRNALSALSR